MKLNDEQQHLLRAVAELTNDDHLIVGTKAAGRVVLEALRAGGAPYFWESNPPWYGTQRAAKELESAGFLNIDYGIARYRHWNEPTQAAQEYGLEMTSQGREYFSRN